MSCTGIFRLDPRCLAGSAASNIADDAFSKMAQSFGSAAGSATNWLWQRMDDATSVDLHSAGISNDLIATGTIAVVLCLGLFAVQIITSVLRREPGGLIRAARGLAIATIATSFAIAATQLVLAAVDDLSAGVVRFATGADIDALGSRFALATSLAQLTNSAGLLLFSLVILLAVVIVWSALMVRKLLIIVAAVMTPIAFAGGAADVTRGWIRRWIEFTAALIASKLLLVVMLLIGFSIFEGAGLTHNAVDGSVGVTQAGTQLATGTVLLLLAGLAPWIAIRMCHFAGESLHAVHAQAQAARAGVQTMSAAPKKVAAVMSQGGAYLARPSGATLSNGTLSSSAPPTASAPRRPVTEVSPSQGLGAAAAPVAAGPASHAAEPPAPTAGSSPSPATSASRIGNPAPPTPAHRAPLDNTRRPQSNPAS